MNEQLFELVVEKNHLNIIIKALSNYICSQYDWLDAEVVDIPKTMENIKIASDMQLVLKHHLGGIQHTPKQTAEATGLVWIRDVDVENGCWDGTYHAGGVFSNGRLDNCTWTATPLYKEDFKGVDLNDYNDVITKFEEIFNEIT